MKKSTLITTIAMIVVVVVALSTATYAWFTSDSVTTVEATMTTTAQQGWLVSGGTVANSNGTATVTYTASLPELHMYNGLYAPIGVINGTLTDETNGASGSFAENKFHTATQIGVGLASTALCPTSDGAYVYAVEQVNYSNLNVMSVTNNNEGDGAKNLELTIYVYINKATPTNAEMLAAKSFNTYIAASDGEEYFTEYHYTATTAFASGEDAYTATYGGKQTGSISTNTIEYSKDTNTKTVKDGGTISTGFSVAATTTLPGQSTPLTNGAKYYSMTIDLGSVNKSDKLDLVFYAWFDGWALDNTASGGSVSVLYSFATKVTT